MSIWSTIGGVDGLYEVGYGPLGEPKPGTFLDLADAWSWYGNAAIRIDLEGTNGSARAVLSRSQVAKVVQQLQGWLERHDEPEEGT